MELLEHFVWWQTLVPELPGQQEFVLLAVPALTELHYLTGRKALPWPFEISFSHICHGSRPIHTFCVMHTMKPFSSMPYDSTVLAS